MLFKCLLDLNILDPALDHSIFSKNKDRLLEHDVSRRVFSAIVDEARQRKLLPEEHFTVDGTLLEAWASTKTFRPRDGDTPPPFGPGDAKA
jgi:transposase